MSGQKKKNCRPPQGEEALKAVESSWVPHKISHPGQKRETKNADVATTATTATTTTATTTANGPILFQTFLLLDKKCFVSQKQPIEI